MVLEALGDSHWLFPGRLRIIDSYQPAAFRAGFPNTPPLQISGERHDWIGSTQFPLMHMAECPVLIAASHQIGEGAGGRSGRARRRIRGRARWGAVRY